MKIVGDIGVEDSGNINIKVSKPKTLSGMTINISGEKVRINYLGISSKIDKKDLPSSAFFSVINSVMNEISSNDSSKNFEKVGESFKGEFDTNFGKMTVILNNSFQIKSIKIDNMGFNLKLENIKTNA